MVTEVEYFAKIRSVSEKIATLSFILKDKKLSESEYQEIDTGLSKLEDLMDKLEQIRNAVRL